MKVIKNSIVAVFALVIYIFSSLTVYASSDESVPLKEYESKLEEINVRLGTSYALASENELEIIGESMDSQKEFITAMSLDEFESYIIDLYYNDQKSRETQDTEQLSKTVFSDDQLSADKAMRAVNSQQFHFYDNVHWFELNTKVVTVNNVVYYNSFVSAGTGFDLTNTYPQYKSYNTSYTVSADSRQMTVTYYCTRYLSQYITDGVSYSIPIVFTAGE